MIDSPFRIIIEIFNYKEREWEKYTICNDYWEEFATIEDLETIGYDRTKDIRSLPYEDFSNGVRK